MELREYWDILRRRWWLPIGVTLVALIASSIVGIRGATAFKSDMRIAVSTTPTIPPNAATGYDPNYYATLSSEYVADDMTEFMTSRAFATEVQRELANSSYKIDPAAVVGATRAKKTHRFIDVTVTTSTLEEGQAIAGSISRIIDDRARMATYMQSLASQNTSLNLVTPPDTHRANTPLGLASEITLRTLIGLFVGIALAFLVHYLDPSLRTRSQAESELQLPVLGEIPRTGGRGRVAA
ncbi:MAG: hypothetical protein NVSMB2_18270 [Chloroflexota bacterium]